jgi:hypothetical protein
VGRLHALTVEAHVAAPHRFGGGAATLEQSRAPQPAVDAQPIRVVVVLFGAGHCVSQKQYA